MSTTAQLPDSLVFAPDDKQHSNGAFLSALVVLVDGKWYIVGATMLVMLLAGVLSLFIHDSFQAEAVILPPQQQQSSLAVLASGALGGLAGTGVASQLGLKNSADLYIGILKSHTVSDEIINKFHLQELYHEKLLSDTRSRLKKHVSFTSGKESMIFISVEDSDPKRAAEMANAFVDELYKVNSQLAITDASQRRLFFEQQLRKQKDSMNEAEIALKQTQQTTGLLIPNGQAEVLIRSAAQLRAEIARQQVTLQATRSYATDQNPQIQVLQREIATMQAQLGQFENSGTKDSRLEVSAGKLPGASLEYMRKLRDVKYFETLYELLAKQYEAAVIDEAKLSPVIQVIDRAKRPDKKSGPGRIQLTLGSGLLALIMSSLYLLTIHNLRVIANVPRYSILFHALRSGLRCRS